MLRHTARGGTTTLCPQIVSEKMLNTMSQLSNEHELGERAELAQCI